MKEDQRETDVGCEKHYENGPDSDVEVAEGLSGVAVQSRNVGADEYKQGDKCQNDVDDGDGFGPSLEGDAAAGIENCHLRFRNGLSLLENALLRSVLVVVEKRASPQLG